VAQEAGGGGMTKFLVAGGFLVLNLYTYHFLATREEYPPRTPFSEFPLELGHCLPGSGWDIIASDVAPLELPDPGTIHVNRLIIAKGETRALVYYWYQSRGRVIAEDWRKVLYQFWDRATRLRTDGSLVRFTVPIVRGDVDRADATVLDLASQIVPMLPSFVPN
jgi:EpsI family protein